MSEPDRAENDVARRNARQADQRSEHEPEERRAMEQALADDDEDGNAVDEKKEKG